jgi:hypothetical protein
MFIIDRIEHNLVRREELDINLAEIIAKLRCVILPIPSRALQRASLLRDNPDFWGPVNHTHRFIFFTCFIAVVATCCPLFCSTLRLRSNSCMLQQTSSSKHTSSIMMYGSISGRVMDHHHMDIWFSRHIHSCTCSRRRSKTLTTNYFVFFSFRLCIDSNIRYRIRKLSVLLAILFFHCFSSHSSVPLLNKLIS